MGLFWAREGRNGSDGDWWHAIWEDRHHTEPIDLFIGLW